MFMRLWDVYSALRVIFVTAGKRTKSEHGSKVRSCTVTHHHLYKASSTVEYKLKLMNDYFYSYDYIRCNFHFTRG